MSKRLSHPALTVTVIALLSTAPAAAQFIAPPGGGAMIVPPPAPMAPLTVAPPVPKLDELPRVQNAPQARGSFGDRITNCLQDGAAAGLNSGDRATYSRSCANR